MGVITLTDSSHILLIYDFSSGTWNCKSLCSVELGDQRFRFDLILNEDPRAPHKSAARQQLSAVWMHFCFSVEKAPHGSGL